MILIAAAAAIATLPTASGHHAPPAMQAIATVRILKASRVHFGDGRGDRDTPRAHNALISTNLGRQPARLIEFE